MSKADKSEPMARAASGRDLSAETVNTLCPSGCTAGCPALPPMPATAGDDNPGVIRILYVDDDTDLLTIGRQFLERNRDFSVETTSFPFDALALLATNFFDVVVSDFQMPGLNGIELLKKIRASGNRIPFIVFTGTGREEVILEVINNGADSYLQKRGNAKIQFAELEYKIRRIVRIYRDEMTLMQANRNLEVLNYIIQNETINALTGIFGLVDMAACRHDSDNCEYEIIHIRRLAQVIQRQIALIRDYQDIGRQAPAWQNLAETIQISLSQSRTGDATVSVNVGDRELFSDRLLGRVFSTLVKYSCRPGKNATEIRIFAEDFPEALRIVYEDNGLAVLEGEKEQIFKREYYQQNGSDLYLARETLRTTGISIHETGKPGGGCRFEMIVPAVAHRSADKGKFV